MAWETAGGAESERPDTAWSTGAFARIDEEPDARFYDVPRFVQHIDEGAIAAVTDTIRRHVSPGADMLDLMSSWVSHLPAPAELPLGRVVGLGLNAEELTGNPRLSQWTVQDLNADPCLSYADVSFGAVLITVSIQYLIRPDLVLREVARVLTPGGVVIISFSNRMFPTKAVAFGRKSLRRSVRSSSPPTSAPPGASTNPSSRSIVPAPAGSAATLSGPSSPDGSMIPATRYRRRCLSQSRRCHAPRRARTCIEHPVVANEEGAVHRPPPTQQQHPASTSVAAVG